MSPATLTQSLTLTLTLILTKLSVEEQDVTGAKSWGYSALKHDFLGHYVGCLHFPREHLYLKFEISFIHLSYRPLTGDNLDYSEGLLFKQ